MKLFLEACENSPIASVLLGLGFLFCGLGVCVTTCSVWKSAADSVCFAHHAPVECDPSLRVRTYEEAKALNEEYMRCLDRHADYICEKIFRR